MITLGFLVFFTFKGKLMLTAIWKTLVCWDYRIEKIKAEDQKLRNKWIKGLKYIHEYEISRCYFTFHTGVDKYEFLIFVDARENSLAGEAYVFGCFRHHGESMIVQKLK